MGGTFIKEHEFLEERFRYMTRKEQDAFSSAIETGQAVSLQQMINLSYNLDCCGQAESYMQKENNYLELYSGDWELLNTANDKRVVLTSHIRLKDMSQPSNFYPLALPVSELQEV